MPKKLSINEVKDRVEKYGYFIQDGETYDNAKKQMRVYDAQLNRIVKLSLNQMNYKITSGQRAEYDINDVLPVSLNPEQPQHLTPFQRFLKAMSEYTDIKNANNDEKQKMFTEYQNLCKLLANARKRNKTVKITWNKPGIKSRHMLFSFITALQSIEKSASVNKRILIEPTDNDGTQKHYNLQPDTFEYLVDLLKDVAPQEMKFSESDIYESYDNWKHVEVSFKPIKNNQGGFFPYINKTSLDLSLYGIFSSIDEENYKENCFIQALRNSNVFSDEEMKLIKSFINTRVVRVEDIQEICDTMKCEINIRFEKEMDDKQREKKGKSKNEVITSSKRFLPADCAADKKVVIILHDFHFMVSKPVYVSEYYIKHYEELDKTNDAERFIIQNDNGEKKRMPMNIIRVIRLMKENGCFTKISNEDKRKLASLYEHFKYMNCDSVLDVFFRPIRVKDKNAGQMKYLNRTNGYDGFKLFGTHIPLNKLDYYYEQLQKLIDELLPNKRIDVSCYYSYSSLMEKIMYEYGCFDNVFEITGPIADKIRDSLVFPVPHTANNKPFYSNKKLYYIDLNGAYLSCVNSIPAGKCDNNGVFSAENTLIKELIEKMYEIRCKIQDPVLKTAFKFIMTSSWGLSIKKNKHIKQTSPKNMQKFIDENEYYIMEYDDKFIKYISSINVAYSYPQFARKVLESFNNKIAHIASLVKRIYYYNIDAILIDEDDYNKLNELGYIGTKLGDFKIEHVFTEIAIKSPRQYVAKLDDNTMFFHVANNKVKDEVYYNEFVDTVKSSPETTLLI